MLKRSVFACLLLLESNAVLADRNCLDIVKHAIHSYNQGTESFNQAVDWRREAFEAETLKEKCRLFQRSKSIIMGAKKNYLGCDSGFFQASQHCDNEQYAYGEALKNISMCRENTKEAISFHVKGQRLYDDNCIGTQ